MFEAGFTDNIKRVYECSYLISIGFVLIIPPANTYNLLIGNNFEQSEQP